MDKMQTIKKFAMVDRHSCNTPNKFKVRNMVRVCNARIGVNLQSVVVAANKHNFQGSVSIIGKVISEKLWIN